MWSVATILTGLYSFMLDSAPTLGSVDASVSQRRKYAAQSLEFNCRNETFCSMFPQYVDLLEERRRQSAAGLPVSPSSGMEERGAAHPGGGVGQNASHGGGVGGGGGGGGVNGVGGVQVGTQSFDFLLVVLSAPYFPARPSRPVLW